MTHAEFTPHANITLSNSGGIEIMLNRSNDGVYYRFNYGQYNLDQEEIFEAEIVYLSTGEDDNDEMNAGFYHDGDKDIFYSLNEAMRINY